jgi:hypothetical protein
MGGFCASRLFASDWTRSQCGSRFEEGLDETLTVYKVRASPPQLRRILSFTNVIESVAKGVIIA